MSSLKDLTAKCEVLEARCATLEEVTKELHKRLGALSDEVDQLRPRWASRNRSSSDKRDMNEEDARACLIGDYRGLVHKDAAERMGLTYAQVYSCRLEYTFKHIHKDLRDGGWKNPWTK